MKTCTFGPDDALIGSVTLPPSGASDISVIIWGLGLAEVLLARRLARWGVMSLQVRISGEAFNDDDRRNEIYDRRGVELCRAAMDKLGSEHGAQRFVLMGNCATGNLCFNTARADTRTTGAIITNPYFGRRQPWLLKSLRNIARMLFGKRADIDYRRDIFLPLDFDQALQHLCDRGVRMMLACTTADESLYYLTRAWRRTFSDLQSGGRLHLQVIEGDAHVFNEDETAAAQLNDGICDWLSRGLIKPPASTPLFKAQLPA